MHAKGSLAVLALSLAFTARAQSLPRFDLERLTLDPAARTSLVVGGGEVGPAGTGRVSAALQYEREPLVLQRSGLLRGYGLGAHDGQGDIVKHRLTIHAGLALALTDFLELDVRVPYMPWQDGDDLTSKGLSKPTTQGVGSISAGLKLALLRQSAGAGMNLALASDVVTDWGNVDALAGNDRVAFTPRLEASHQFGGVVLSAQAGGYVRTKNVAFVSPNGDARTLRSEILGGVALSTTGHPVDVEISGRGAWNFDGLGQSYEALAGARWHFGPGELFALAGPGFNESPGTPRYRALLGLAVNWGAAAPPPPAPAPAAEAPAPAPAPPPDPCAAGQTHTPDQCPNLDDDGDGIPNGQDACPLEPGIPELKGCPAKDSDGDGIPDHLDKCPTVPGVAEYQGCPPPTAAEIKQNRITTLEPIYFDSGKATIQERSNAVLDDVAQVLTAHAELAHVTIEGHTDSTGKAAANMRLSQARAEAVRAYLVSKGVAADRLTAKGFGQTRPVASNKTAAGREKNRRVEFVLQQQ